MKKPLLLCLALITLMGVSVFFLGTTTSANSLKDSGTCTEQGNAKCIPRTTDPALTEDCRQDGASCNPVAKYLNPLINTLAAAVGIAVVIGIIVGGIQYASSGGDPQKAAAGKQHIKTAIIALLAFFFMYAFLQFTIPGGILTR